MLPQTGRCEDAPVPGASITGRSAAHGMCEPECEGRRRLGTKFWSQENSYAADPVCGAKRAFSTNTPSTVTTLGVDLRASTSSSDATLRRGYSIARIGLRAPAGGPASRQILRIRCQVLASRYTELGEDPVQMTLHRAR